MGRNKRHWIYAHDHLGNKEFGKPSYEKLSRPRPISALRIAACIAALDASLAWSAESVTLHPVADTTLFETNPLNNLGANTNFVAGTTAGSAGEPFRSRAVMKFDVASQLPSGATVISATLTLTVVKIPTVPANSGFELHRLLVSWGEGNKSGNIGLPATRGEATWSSRFFLLPQWAVPGGAPGKDFLTAESSSTQVQGQGSYTFASTSNLTADVQGWLDNTDANFGWILISQDEATASTARRFASRESDVGAPTLLVDFVPPPVLADAGRQDTNCTFHFTVEAGYDYTVEYTDTLPSTNWLVLTNVGAKIVTFEAAVTNSLQASPSRFYRLQRVPCNCR